MNAQVNPSHRVLAPHRLIAAGRSECSGSYGLTVQAPPTPPVQDPGQDGLWTLLQVDQQRITALDTVTVAIKGWVVTLDAALAGFAFSKDHSALLLVAMIATALFLPLDVRYRQIQLLHADRSDRIERQIAPEYRLRSDPKGMVSHRYRLVRRYLTTITFYAAVLASLLVLFSSWLTSRRGSPSPVTQSATSPSTTPWSPDAEYGGPGRYAHSSKSSTRRPRRAAATTDRGTPTGRIAIAHLGRTTATGSLHRDHLSANCELLALIVQPD